MTTTTGTFTRMDDATPEELAVVVAEADTHLMQGVADHLLAQATLAVPAADAFIAQHLIDQIDEAGYLTVSPLDLASRLAVPLVRVERVLAIVQTFDPTGVGARDLAECLALQAREADRYDPCIARLIDNLDLVARGTVPPASLSIARARPAAASAPRRSKARTASSAGTVPCSSRSRASVSPCASTRRPVRLLVSIGATAPVMNSPACIPAQNTCSRSGLIRIE